MSALKVGLLGLGTVGSGVAKILLEQPGRMTARAGRPLELCRVAVRDVNKPRGVELPDGILTDDPRAIVNDDEIDVAIELIGGIEPARTLVRDLIESGKDVVTANKALLAEHGDELFALARNQGRSLAFEAAVAGGVPIIAALGQSMTSNQITSIEAILNGTSNFVLTQMLQCDRSYEEVIAEAQRLGYAEADPAMDVDGTDAAQKLSILVQLAYGTKTSLADFSRQGIDNLELADLKYAEELGYTVKLLAVAKLQDHQLEMHVQPTLVHHDRPLAQVHGPFNMIALEGDVVGPTWFSGPGAGQMPTASAVVADLIDIACGRAAVTFPTLDLWNDRTPIPVQPPEEISNRYYLRFNVEDRPHVFADIADILGRHDISLASIIQHEAPELGENDAAASPSVPVVVMTHRTAAGNVYAAERELSQLTTLERPLVRMPVAD